MATVAVAAFEQLLTLSLQQLEEGKERCILLQETNSDGATDGKMKQRSEQQVRRVRVQFPGQAISDPTSGKRTAYTQTPRA